MCKEVRGGKDSIKLKVLFYFDYFCFCGGGVGLGGFSTRNLVRRRDPGPETSRTRPGTPRLE